MACEPFTRLERILLFTLYFVILAGIVFVVFVVMMVSEYKKYIRDHCRSEDEIRQKEVSYKEVGTQTPTDSKDEDDVEDSI